MYGERGAVLGNVNLPAHPVGHNCGGSHLVTTDTILPVIGPNLQIGDEADITRGQAFGNGSCAGNVILLIIPEHRLAKAREGFA